MWLVFWLGCASLVGLEELEAPPADFPLALVGDPGHITRAPSGAISVDLAFDEKSAARTAAEALRTEAERDGFRFVNETQEKKRSTVRLEGTGGRVDIGCCSRRADRRWLVLLTWWPAR